MDKKVMFGSMVVLAMFAVIGMAMPATAQEVYLVPQHSSARYCNTTPVEIWVNATDFQGGQINLTYSPACANVTKWERSTTFPLGFWTHSVGGEWIGFTAIASLTGKYLIGTLTIHCISEEECNTMLDFITTGAKRSALFYPDGSEIVGVTWTDGTFECLPPKKDTIPPYTSGHDPAKGAINVPVDTNIVVHVRDDRPDDTGVNKTTILMKVEGTIVTPTITGTSADYKLEYNPLVDFSYGQVVDVTIDASDIAGNVMPTDSYNFTIVSVPPENRGFFVPEHSVVYGGCCRSTNVAIWVNATDFQSGQIKVAYNSSCVNVTNWVGNTAVFTMGGWDSSVDGREWITFLNTTHPLTGEYKIGTLTIHCVCCVCEECSTPLDFVTAEAMPSMLFDDIGNEIAANWIDGTFECKKGICGDVAPYPGCDQKVNMGDVTRLLNNVTYSGRYPLCIAWAGDVNCKAGINMGDVTLLLNNVSYPGDPKYALNCC